VVLTRIIGFTTKLFDKSCEPENSDLGQQIVGDITLIGFTISLLFHFNLIWN
jgi:hypothetical protein